MNSTFLHQKANELVQSTGSRDIRTITQNTGIQIHEMPFTSISGFFTFQWDSPCVFINSDMDKQTKQMACGYALSRYAEAYLFSEKATFQKMNYISYAHLSEYEPNAFSSHLMLDSAEIYYLTQLGYDAQQIAEYTKRHLHLILVKLLELHHMGVDLTHYHDLHKKFMLTHNHLAHLGFD